MKEVKSIILSSIITIAVVSFALVYIFNVQVNDNRDSSDGSAKVVNALQVDEANSSINASRRNIITETVQKVSPAVVGINVTETVQYRYRSPFASDPFWSQFFQDQVVQRQLKGLGSGAIISPDGYILTNDHVAGNASKVIVTMTDGKHYDAKIIGTDLVSDICVLKIDAENLPYISLAKTDELLIGEWVIALGNPFGLFAINDKPTVTVGVISATGMNLGANEDRYYPNMIQTDASINNGNSGGPLVNAVGEMIGMNTLIYSKSGGSVGVGFAIPIQKIKSIIEELKTKGQVDRKFWTGLSIQTIDERIAKYYNLKSVRGVIVTVVAKDSPAYKAGIMVGDIINQVEDFRINDDATLISILQEYRTDDVITFEIVREGQVIKKPLKLERRDD
ncbi:MAG: trypsin-like peptidase domain-containing protein [Bacteroidetes bacterium]|nr:trypsin-like peptidase domain-containing protein [Bacteroidota bacterium]